MALGLKVYDDPLQCTVDTGADPARSWAIWKGGAKNRLASERAEGARKFLGRWSRKFSNSLIFLLNNALLCMFPRIQNETLKKSAF